jgi:peptidoglycan/LPS O-acetylase OafA/YrhL
MFHWVKNLINQNEIMKTNFISEHQRLISMDGLATNVASAYRKDIDGLRGFAVLSVVLYHIFSSLLPGGFVGVDIFFVISGYLISKYIYADLERSHFSLKEFYTRRIRRILPVFVFFLFVVSIVGFLILMPTDLKSFSTSAFAAMLSISNLYFWKFISIGYFGIDATVLPLLHTWSLGVEEQFYLVWPIVFSLMFNKLSDINRKSWIGVITVILALISFYAYYYFRYHPMMVFYMPMTRAFELLLGAILAIYWSKIKPPSPVLAFCLSLVGLALILYSIIYFTQDDYPSSNILFPCLGAVLLIYSGSTKTLISKFMSSEIIAFWGLISYSLYLWHWPIVAYINYLGVDIDVTVGVVVFLVSVILSIISWLFIEQPFRRKYIFSFHQSLLLFVGGPLFFVGFFVLICYLVPNFGFNKASPEILKIIGDYHGPFFNKSCVDAPTLHPSSENNCSIGDLNKKRPSALLVGDSHAMALAGLLNILLKDAHLKGYIVTQSGTPFILGNIKDWRENLPMKRNNLILNLIQKNHYKYIILGGFWNYYPDSVLEKSTHYSDRSYDKFKHGLDYAIKKILEVGSIPVLIIDIPPLLNIPTQCGFSRVGLGICSNSLNKVKEIQHVTSNILLSIKKSYPDAIIIDPLNVICQKKKCFSALQGIPLYHTGKENSHLNYAGSELMGKIYLHDVGNPFA